MCPELFGLFVCAVCFAICLTIYMHKDWLLGRFGRHKTSPDEVIEGEEADKVIREMEQEFWISDKGVLHNPLCRWYKNCDGTVWDGKTEHKNCGACGGDRPIVHKWNLKK